MKVFKDFKLAVNQQLDNMINSGLFCTEVSKEVLWDTYLNSFPEGSNPIYKEKTEHDCNCCKSFIRSGGNLVSIVDNKLVSIWDINIGGHYQVVADALSKLVKSFPVTDMFLHTEPQLGTDFNHQEAEDGKIIKWEHFYYKLPKVLVNKDPGKSLGEVRTSKEIFKRGLDEITLDSLETTLELIAQNSLYRGEENTQLLKAFLKYKREYLKLSIEAQHNYCWATSKAIGGLSRLRNTSIGTLLIDLSEGKDLDIAVAAFESKVAPTNYKRPSALVTESMLENAQKKVIELGIEDSLQRRYAITEDITINNILFADRSIKKTMNVFDELVNTIPEKVGNLDKIEEVSIDNFITNILPKANSIELMVSNSHTNNLMSLIAPTILDAKPIFKWENNFSWSYYGEVTDSIKERVKAAGGNVVGELRCSLSWFNYDDLDLHIIEPNRNEIYHANKRSITSGHLDVDMNAFENRSRTPVENIIWSDKNKMREGIYSIQIKQFNQRENVNFGFELEIEHNNQIHKFTYDKKMVQSQIIEAVKFEYSKTKGITFISSLPKTTSSKEIWNINTEKFHKVIMVMNSPNHWDGYTTGNKHIFFILNQCRNVESTRGFYNEFLRNDLNEHRKVFEILGSKMKVPYSDNQLSGLGFSTTVRNSVLCKVSGSFNRIIKINF